MRTLRIAVAILAAGLTSGLTGCNGLTWDAPNAPLPHDSCYWSYTYARGSTTVKTDSTYGCLHFVHGQS